MTPQERAQLALLLLQRAPEAEHVAVLQAMQQLVQSELVRLWRRADGMPGPYTWPIVERKSEK